MAKCAYCNQEFPDERAEIGYDYCLSELCHTKGLGNSHQQFREEYTPALLHKCNYFWVKRTDLPNLRVKG